MLIIQRLNPKLPKDAREEAICKVLRSESASLMATMDTARGQTFDMSVS